MLRAQYDRHSGRGARRALTLRAGDGASPGSGESHVCGWGGPTSGAAGRGCLHGGRPGRPCTTRSTITIGHRHLTLAGSTSWRVAHGHYAGGGSSPKQRSADRRGALPAPWTPLDTFHVSVEGGTAHPSTVRTRWAGCRARGGVRLWLTAAVLRTMPRWAVTPRADADPQPSRTREGGGPTPALTARPEFVGYGRECR